MIHSEIKDVLPAYALDALGPIDRLEVRAHLEVCNTCEELLREYAEGAAEFAFAVPPVRPSSALRDRLFAEVGRTNQVLPIGLRNGRSRIPRGAAVVGATLVLVIGAMVGLIASRVTSGDQFVPEVVSLLSSPRVNAIAMTPTGEDPNATGRVFVPDDAQGAAVIMTGLDDPGDGFYQLAVVLNGETFSVRTFKPDRTGVAVVMIRRSLESLESVIVTQQTKAGSGVSTGRTILKSP